MLNADGPTIEVLELAEHKGLGSHQRITDLEKRTGQPDAPPGRLLSSEGQPEEYVATSGEQGRSQRTEADVREVDWLHRGAHACGDQLGELEIEPSLVRVRAREREVIGIGTHTQRRRRDRGGEGQHHDAACGDGGQDTRGHLLPDPRRPGDRKSTRLNSSHITISYAVFCLK